MSFLKRKHLLLKQLSNPLYVWKTIKNHELSTLQCLNPMPIMLESNWHHHFKTKYWVNYTTCNWFCTSIPHTNFIYSIWIRKSKKNPPQLSFWFMHVHKVGFLRGHNFLSKTQANNLISPSFNSFQPWITTYTPLTFSSPHTMN
jgi:hypothetical protein